MFLRFLFVLVACLACLQGARGGWTKYNANTLAWLRDVHFVDARRGFVGGGGGALLETTDGGRTWTKRGGVTGDDIRQIYFTDADTGWLLCERDRFGRGEAALSYLLKTTDGGASWARVEFADAGRARVTRIFFGPQGAGYAIGEGGAFFALAPGEAGPWRRAASPVRYLLLDGALAGAGGAVVGAAGSVFFTADGGASWNPASLFGDRAARLNAVFFADARNGWAVGAGGRIFQTTSGGRTWREQKAGVEADLLGVFFRNTADGWAVGDDGLILRTTTAGNVWTAEETGTRHRLEKIAFAGPRGVAVGFGGTILIYEDGPAKPVPADRPALQKRN